ncbi:MAG: alkaline phosphatase family protein [Caldilineaceae bacterium]|nr:alkaline phosphatase family protein [Caldilineaceae bacterium]MCB0140448.1 alkaline phosphatase family protein [Caldilineaceae bacterium]
MNSTQRRILIIGADGLRPDLLDPELMPTVSRLAAEGVWCREHHAVYPTHTRVNMSALTSGCMPGQHGIMANTMIAPPVDGRPVTEDHIIDTSSYQHINTLEQATGGQALLVPGLGDLLAARGERVAVAGTGSAGATMLWTHRHMSRVVNPNSAFGIADLYDLREKLGELPARQRPPQLEAQRYATRAVTDLYLDDPRNRVIVFWMCEPDASLHYYGLGSPESQEALRTVDACVAELVSELERRGLREQFDLFFLSDHGHSTVQAHNTLGQYLRYAAAEIGRSFQNLVTASDYIYAEPGTTEPSADELAPLVEWLLAQPWTGVVLGGRPDLAQLPGLFSLETVWGGHTNARRPLLAVSPKWSEDVNEFGVPGAVMSLTTQAALKSSHGSLSPYDLHAVCIAHGPSFQQNVWSEIPTGAVDLLPTVLTLLEQPLPSHLHGRVLWEIMQQPQGEPGEIADEAIAPAVDTGATTLQMHQVGQTRYVHGAFVGSENVEGWKRGGAEES